MFVNCTDLSACLESMAVDQLHLDVECSVVEDCVRATAGEQELQAVECTVVVGPVAHARPVVEAARVGDDWTDGDSYLGGSGMCTHGIR